MDSEVLGLIKWLAGICVTGFLFLAGWMWHLNTKMAQKVSYEWIEKTFKAEMKAEIKTVTNVLEQIRDALLGDMKSEGLISRVRRNEERCSFHKVIQKVNEEKPE